jgi:hypothetical protein
MTEQAQKSRSTNLIALLYRSRNKTMCVTLIERGEQGQYKLYPIAEKQVEGDIKSVAFQDTLRETIFSYEANRGVAYWLSGKKFHPLHSILSGHGAFLRDPSAPPVLEPAPVALTSAASVMEKYMALVRSSARAEHQVTQVRPLTSPQ